MFESIQNLLEKEFSVEKGFSIKNMDNLISNGSNLHRPVNKDGDYLIHCLLWCIFRYNNTDIDKKLSYLTSNNCDLNVYNKRGETPLEIICLGFTKNYYEKQRMISNLIMLGVLQNRFYIDRIQRICSTLDEEDPYETYYSYRLNDDVCKTIYTYIKYSFQTWSLTNHHNTDPSVRNAVWTVCLIINRVCEQGILDYHLPMELWLLICSFFVRKCG
uniref:Ankyrin repeat protein n=1 Tax=viral metagenome TaxID=1070528 RepID=A0A6C0EKG3_9ZZZZ